MLILSVLHNLFLTTEQTQLLYGGEGIEIIGASLPVWYYKGSTSEPAEEVFCKYLLTNQRDNSPFLISLRERRDGYVINMPQISDSYLPRSLTDDEWREMTPEQQLDWYEEHPVPLSAKNLLPIAEGGAEYLHFKEHGKVMVNNKNVAAIHVVEIKTMESLMDSFD